MTILKKLQPKIQEFIQCLVKAISAKNLQNNEEFILNGVSCLTNLIFYDLPSTNLLSDETRADIFHQVSGYILATQNEEIQVESMRVISNLSRH